MVSAIAENPGSCDEVWLCNLSGKPTLKKSEEYIEEKLLPVAELFRSKGITVSLQIAETVSFPKNITKRWGGGLVQYRAFRRKIRQTFVLFRTAVTYDTHAGVGYLLSEEYAELLTDDEIEAL